MEKFATIVGGPRDGRVVPIMGPTFCEPVHPRGRFIPSGDETMPFDVREYDLHDWLDASEMEEWTLGPRYVLRGVRLGQS